MTIFYIINNISAIALPSLRISPLLLIRIVTIALFYAAALLISVVYIQSIGSGIGNFSGLFYDFLSETITSAGLLVSSLVPIKSKRLTDLERSQFTLSDELKQILVGLLLGDLYAIKRYTNARLRFKQGIVHKDYLMHLYEIFSDYCSTAPKINNPAPDKRTGTVYKGIYFNTKSLPCFNELYNLFYPEGVKVVPSNIFELLTPLGLAYFISDDGTFTNSSKIVKLCTEGFIESDIDLLIQVLEQKFNLVCRKEKRGKSFRIVIKNQSLETLRKLISSHLHSSMLYKIGL